jgi:CPA2 family monovalent cation:H+ antiporter-2
VLGGVTWVSSSGIAAKALSDLGLVTAPETPAILSVLVTEDLAMAVFVPLVGSLLIGGGVLATLGSVAIAVCAALAALAGALRFGEALGKLVEHHSEEVAGAAEELQVSAAIGAFLVGIALSGEIAHRTHVLLAPIRDFTAALFFLLFALQVDTGQLGAVLAPAFALAVVTGATKLITGWRAAALAGADGPERLRAGAALIARGEMSIVLAGLATQAAIEPRLTPLATAYVLIMAVAGPLLMHLAARPAAVLARPT